MTNSHFIKHCKQQKCTLENCYANKSLKMSIAVRFNPLLVCPSVRPFFRVIYTFSTFMFRAVIKMFTQYIAAVSTE